MNHRAILPVLFTLSLAASLQASLQSDIGFTQLKQEYGAALPTGSNITVLQVEAPDASGNWAVAKSGEQSTRKITFPFATTTPTTYSAHANLVATNLAGVTTSILPGLGELKSASVSSYRNCSLNLAAFASPAPAAWDVENHSLISNITTYNLNAIDLLDYRIDRDLVSVVIALENGVNTMQPLWGNNYNTIAVGTATGQHSRGGTNLDGSGRMKPDLVGTATYTSYATPVVTSAAGLLIAETKRTSELAAAKDPRVIKALLMAGAAKEPFPAWTRTVAQPLDPVYGAGEVNIYNSYKMLLAGRQADAANGKRLSAATGWNTAVSGPAAVYYFEIPAGQTAKFSTVLTWHRVLTTSNYWAFTSTLADLNLRLRSSDSSFALGTVVAESASALDNVEHIYCPTLPAGKYALEVTGAAATTYGLAWNSILSGSTATIVAPTISAQPLSVSVTAGQPASFAVTASGSSLTYQWSKDSVLISGATSSTYTIAATTQSSSGKYTVAVANSAGAVSSAAATLSVTAATTVSNNGLTELAPASASARGQNGTKEVVANLFDHVATTKWLDFSGTTWVQVAFATPRSLDAYSLVSANDYPVRDPYNWTLSGSNDGVTWTVIETRAAQTFASRFLQRDFVLAQTSAAFTCFRLDITCQSGAITQLADLKFWSAQSSTTTTTPTTPTVVAPAITTQPAALAVTAGQPASFTITATGDTLAYQWKKNGVALTGATAATYTIATTCAADAADYSVTVSNSASSVTSACAALIVNAATPSATPVELIPASFSARGQNGTKEVTANLFDHVATTKWLDFSGTTWVQVAFATPRSLDAYSLVSANDYPVRDPYNWTLSGSNDGVTWTVIETRTAETFASRFLQRDFVLAQTSAAFTYFRLEITCKSGAITQLADLEFWGR